MIRTNYGYVEHRNTNKKWRVTLDKLRYFKPKATMVYPVLRSPTLRVYIS